MSEYAQKALAKIFFFHKAELHEASSLFVKPCCSLTMPNLTNPGAASLGFLLGETENEERTAGNIWSN